ncbi:MAG: enoyl-CoA hydratase [Rhodothermales bacterium]|nr:enoyl-CoA hydratase [Rhodothermales bacterium]
MTENIITEIEDGILTITISRPERKNALTTSMYESLSEALATSEHDDDVRVIVLTGNGADFTAGNDLRDFLDFGKSSSDYPPIEFIKQLAGTSKPVVAAVHGSAIGIGTTLLFHCDIVVVAEDARFQLPFVNLGLSPEAASSLLVPRLAGLHLASELFLTGRPFGSETAWRCGFVNKIVERDEVDTEARRFASRISSFPLASVLLTKKLIRAPLREQINSVMDTETDHFARRLESPEAREAFTAFFEKRPADFSGF